MACIRGRELTKGRGVSRSCPIAERNSVLPRVRDSWKSRIRMDDGVGGILRCSRRGQENRGRTQKGGTERMMSMHPRIVAA
jgi:hypothetical protein